MKTCLKTESIALCPHEPGPPFRCTPCRPTGPAKARGNDYCGSRRQPGALQRQATAPRSHGGCFTLFTCQRAYAYRFLGVSCTLSEGPRILAPEPRLSIPPACPFDCFSKVFFGLSLARRLAVWPALGVAAVDASPLKKSRSVASHDPFRVPVKKPASSDGHRRSRRATFA